MLEIWVDLGTYLNDMAEMNGNIGEAYSLATDAGTQAQNALSKINALQHQNDILCVVVALLAVGLVISLLLHMVMFKRLKRK